MSQIDEQRCPRQKPDERNDLPRQAHLRRPDQHEQSDDDQCFTQGIAEESGRDRDSRG